MRTWIVATWLSVGPLSGADPAQPADGPAVTEAVARAAADAGEPACAAPAPAKPAPKPSPYKGVFYDNNFAYLDQPGAAKTEYFELLKRLHLSSRITLDIGGEYRNQFKDENRRSLFTGSITTPRTDSFTLDRVRVYADLRYDDWLRGYIEYIDASSFYEDLPPLSIDVNRSDLLNAFGELRLLQLGNGGPLRLRVGREELLYGEQRLISPLDWANTRRTFEGAKLFSRGTCWDWDLFWTRPVIVNPVQFDQPDQSQWLGGLYTTYKGFQHFTASPYFLVLREEDVVAGPAFGQNHRVGSGNANNNAFTAGAEFKGELDDWLWDIEGAYQFGQYGDNDLSAGMVAVGIGRKFPDRFWKPTVWAWFDYATGDADPLDGTIGTFNQLFPLGHKYYGFLDLVARQNAQDVNFQLFVKPHEKLTLLAWFHLLWLAEARDGMYNVSGSVSRQDITGNSGNEIGTEFDVTATWNVRPGIDFIVGYCHFWSGDFVRNTGGQDFAYLLYTELGVKF